MISPAVYLFVLTQYLLGTSLHAKAAALAFFRVNHYCSNNFCHGPIYLFNKGDPPGPIMPDLPGLQLPKKGYPVCLLFLQNYRKP
jgi:hypothetical protein